MNIVNISIKDIIPYANNPRKNTKAVDTVVDSINQYGFQQPIVVDKNNIIIVGHTRYVDVTIMRWQELTGQEAINQDGVKWNSIVSEDMSAMEEFFEVN